jgi:hypothetical protein
MLFIVASSIESNVAMIILLNVSGMIAQGGAFFVPGEFKDTELNTQQEYVYDVPGSTHHILGEEQSQDIGEDSDIFHSFVPLTALGVDSAYIASESTLRHGK